MFQFVVPMPRLPVIAFVAVTCIAVCDGVTVQEKTKLHAAMRVRQLCRLERVCELLADSTDLRRNPISRGMKLTSAAFLICPTCLMRRWRRCCAPKYPRLSPVCPAKAAV